MKALKLVKSFLDKNTYDEVVENYEQYKEVALASMGVDSISFFELILNIEREIGVKIDFDDLNISDFETLENIEKFIESKRS